jgi:hypothetical protein
MSWAKYIGVVLLLTAIEARAATAWDRPAEDLAERIQAILGPGQAQLSVHNNSSIAAAELTLIRRLLEADLKGCGVVLTGGESANAIHVTLSENATQYVWVAEVVEGIQTQVAMVDAAPLRTEVPHGKAAVLLQATPVVFAAAASVSDEPLLAVLQTEWGMVMLKPQSLEIYTSSPVGLALQKALAVTHSRPIPRDARGRLVIKPDKSGFTAYLPGVQCEGSFAAGASGVIVGDVPVAMRCRDSDDPWPMNGAAGQKAFYNATRNSFSGVLTPGLGIDLPAFYDSVELRRASGSSELIAAVDGSVLLAEPAARRQVSGARDWGSDFALLHSSCGSDAMVLVSGSGEAATDSLRAYALPAQEAIPASAPLAIEGTVMAMSALEDGSDAVIVRANDRSGLSRYEVLRVAAICN